jgi:hypothetical protein
VPPHESQENEEKEREAQAAQAAPAADDLLHLTTQHRLLQLSIQ